MTDKKPDIIDSIADHLVGDPIELMAENKRLRADFNTAKSELQRLADLCKKNLAHWQDALGKLSASQAREANLREALDRLKSACQGASYLDCDVIENVINGALDTPHDDSALKERLRQEREACAKVCDDDEHKYETGRSCAVAIRNLGDE